MMGKHLLVRSKERQQKYGEVFTPSGLVLEILGKLPKKVWEEGKTYLDPACGNGQFLAAALINKLSLGHKTPLKTIYGVDLMADNVLECRQRLLGIMNNEDFFPAHKNLTPSQKTNRTKSIIKTLERNIICADGLKYDYEFRRSQSNKDLKGLVKTGKTGADVITEVNKAAVVLQPMLPF